jgi:DNA-binding transcriptional regulator YdaS (Cro superfamily)
VSLLIQDKLALMMTSAGSQRKLAGLIGVSHQRVGRWLHGARVSPFTGLISNEPTDATIIAAINQAFSIHRDVSRQQARHDRLPFDATAPVYMERKPFADGRPGERVIADHTHWISDKLRERVIVSAANSGRFMNVSVRSTVDLRKYNDRANAFASSDKAQGIFRTDAQNAWRAQIKAKLSDNIVQAPMYTPKEDFLRLALRKGGGSTIRAISGEVVAGRIDEKLRIKHEPATGEVGTQLADQLLFQTIPENLLGESPHAKKTTRRPSARKAKIRR